MPDDRPVTVALTPDGRADAVHDGRLALPLEAQWPLSRLLHSLAHPLPDCVAYAQYQNSSFSSEFQPLNADVSALDFASVAFGAEPDAVNLWLGGAASLSTLHSDSYDNIYCVIAGVKKFLLYPPTDVYWVEEEMRPQGRWTRDEAGKWALEPIIGDPVPWPANVEEDLRDMAAAYHAADEDEEAEDGGEEGEEGEVEEEWDEGPLISRQLRARYANAVYVEVRAGEVLYLPSLWFHCVAQEGDEEGKAVAVNWWYDMQHGPHFAYYQHLRKRVQAHYATLRARRAERRAQRGEPT